MRDDNIDVILTECNKKSDKSLFDYYKPLVQDLKRNLDLYECRKILRELPFYILVHIGRDYRSKTFLSVFRSETLLFFKWTWIIHHFCTSFGRNKLFCEISEASCFFKSIRLFHNYRMAAICMYLFSNLSFLMTIKTQNFTWDIHAHNILPVNQQASPLSTVQFQVMNTKKGAYIGSTWVYICYRNPKGIQELT